MTALLRSIITATILLFQLISQSSASTDKISVVMDDNYPPYIFKNSSGELQGILVDQWKLWQKKTGITVQITATDWSVAQQRMQAGEFDVIDTIFKNEKREQIYDFTRPYATLPVPLFVHKDITGIRGIKDVKGFNVGVKAGDAVIEELKKHDVNSLAEYPSYLTIAQAAKGGELKVFTIDRPPALYYLNKLNIADQFKETAPMYSGQFHRAVLKGNSRLLQIVQSGFDKITDAEYQAIDKTWMGVPLSSSPYIIYIRYTLLASAGVLALFGIWLFSLKRTVNIKTEQLAKSHARFQAIFDNASDAIFLHDPESGQILDVNKRMCELYGYSKAEALKMQVVSEISSGESPYSIQEALFHIHKAATEEPQLFEWHSKHKDGHLFWVEVSMRMAKLGEQTCVLAFVRDIGERKNNELARLANEQRMSSLYNISQYQFTTEQDFLNHALTEIISLTKSSIGYIYFYDEKRRLFILNSWSKEVMKECAITDPQTCYELDKTGLWGEAVRQRKPIILNDYAASNHLKKGYPEGHATLTRFATVPLIIDETIVCVVGVANKIDQYDETDIMQMQLFMNSVWKIVSLKREETERNNLEKQLLHAQKLESLGVLAGGIAHDFNNILTAIIGNAELAKMRLPADSPAQEKLSIIEEASSRAADLAKQMLAYSGKGKFVVENINLNNLLNEMLHLLEVSISKKVILRLNLHEHLPTVKADSTQMRQIIMNLVINASEAMADKSGVIAITTGFMDCDRSYLKDVWLDENLKEGLYVYLEIADTGCGMDKETLGKLFDPFFTTKFTGRGLGMSAVLGIIRGHHGAIKVYSEVGKGTTFKILLPASDKPAELFNGHNLNGSFHGIGTVLLVDDEESVRGIGIEMLKEIGYSVITATDGRDALEQFKLHPEISAVILDLTMPRMDGEQCFRELRILKPDVKVIMSSGYSEQEVCEKFIGKGVAGFIQKPYKLSMLQDVIKKVL